MPFRKILTYFLKKLLRIVSIAFVDKFIASTIDIDLNLILLLKKENSFLLFDFITKYKLRRQNLRNVLKSLLKFFKKL